ncbi:MAG TPA: zinc metallopeptidase, partial [Chthoniobacteraceae bacterium]|nr:zinc metallopeptidase [Chthoniobacteraceae bacterium]
MFLSILLFAFTLIISLWATARVKSVYRKYSQIPASSGVTGAQAAAEILQRAGI